MKFFLLLCLVALTPSVLRGYCFDATSGNPSSDFFVVQSWNGQLAYGGASGLPRPALEIAADLKNHCRQWVSLEKPEILKLKPVSIYNSINRLCIRSEVIFQLPSINGGPWGFRGVAVVGNRCEVRLETTTGKVIETKNIPLTDDASGTTILWLINQLIDPHASVYKDKKAVVRLYNGNGDILTSQQVTWDCECKECGAATGGSTAEIGSVEFTIPISSTRNGRTPITLEFRSDITTNLGRSRLVLNGPEGNFTNSAVTVVRDASAQINSITIGNVIANVVSAPTAADPQRFIVTVSSDRLNAAATVFRTVVFENPVGGISSFEINETLFGKNTQSVYRKPTSNTWEMTTGNGLRKLTESTDVTTLANHEIIRSITEERASASAVYQPVSDRRVTRKKFPWGWETISEVIDPDGLALATTWDFYEAGENTNPPGTTSAATFGIGRLQSLNRYDGQNETHYYSVPIPAPGLVYQQIHETRSPFAGIVEGRRTVESDGYDRLTFEQTTLLETFTNGTQTGKMVNLRNSNTGVNLRREYSDATTYLESQSSEGTFDSTHRSTLSDGTQSATYDTMNGTLLKSVRQKGLFDAAGNQNLGDYSSETLNEQGYVIRMDDGFLTSTTGGFQTKDAYATTVDEFGRPLEISWFPNSSGVFAYITEMEYGCCGLVRERDKFGVDTHYAYDSLRRRVKTNRLGVTLETVYTGRTMSMHRYPENAVGGLLATSLATPSNEISRSVRNLVGDTTESWSRAAADGSLVKTTTATTYAPTATLSRRITTIPPLTADDGGVTPSRSEEYFLDGQLYQETGNLSPNMRFSYSANSTGLLSSKFYLDGVTPRETVTTQLDWLNREVKMTYPGDENADSILDFSAMAYNTLGQLSRSVDPDGVVTLYGYNPLGNQTTVATDMNANGVIDLAVDRVSFSEVRPAYNGFPGKTAFVERTKQSVRIDDAGSPIELSTLQQDTTYDGLRSWSAKFPGRMGIPSSQFGAETVSLTNLGAPGSWTVRTTAPDQTYSIATYTAGRLAASVSYDSTGKILYTLNYSYADPLFRLKSVTDSRTGTTAYTYVSDTVDVVKSTSDPLGRVTVTGFDARGRKISTDLPDTTDAVGAPLTNTTTHHYFPNGMLQETSGAQTYRSSYTYDYAQRLATLTTYGTQTAMTRWEYDTARGLLRSKRFNSPTLGAGTGPAYSYTPAGRVKTRTWARQVNSAPLVTTYQYQPATGELASTTYSDATPPVTISSRDRLGRVLTMTDAAGLHTYTHQLTGPLLTDTITGSSSLAGFTLSHTADLLNRPTTTALSFSSSNAHAATYTYDSAGRLGSILHNGRTAKYSYHPTRQTLASTLMVESNSVANLRHERLHDAAGRLLHTVSYSSLSGPANFKPAYLSKYTLNALDQRTAASELDDRSWTYGYNATGELTRAAKTLTSTGASLEGRNFRYSFDGIGNRTSIQTGGDSAAANLRTATYTPNALNQYTTITQPGFLEIYGKAPTAQTVTVNALATTRQGRDFRKELSYSNTSQLWQTVTTNGGSASIAQHHLPAASTTPTYDLDGNLTSDGQWTYTWDAENRLRSATRTTAALTAGAPYRAISYNYDSLSRKITRSVATTNGGPITTEKFLYDGWNCIAEYTGTTLKKTNLWGLDLSGTLQGAGGVGGLLLITDHSAPITSHYPCYDGNGNIRKLINATTLATTATYDYGPFGELIRATGPYAATNSYRFSTKPQDVDTGYLYYNYRPYDTKTGRWLSRDPIGERGGENLYGFVGNNAIGKWDVLGFAPGVFVRPNHITIFAGHGLSNRAFVHEPYSGDDELKDSDNIGKSFNDPDMVPAYANVSETAAAATIIACNAPRYTHVNRPIVGFRSPEGEIPYPDLPMVIRSALSAAEDMAHEFIESKQSCEITIEVKCYGWNNGICNTKTIIK
jgi:RHS repeat-associated protein